MVIMNMGTKLELYIIRTNYVLANINILTNYNWDGLKIYNYMIKNTLFFSVDVWKKTCEINWEFFILILLVKLWDIT